MVNQSYSRSFTMLPLSMAISALWLSGCASTPTSPKVQEVNVDTVTPISRPVVQLRPQPKSQSNVKAVVNKNNNKNIYIQEETFEPLLDDDVFDELADLLEAADMTMVEDDKLAINRYGDLWDRLRRGYRMSHSRSFYNRRIEGQKNWFATRQDYLNRLTARASRYLYYTVTEAEKRNLPTELALLPVIESSYDPGATSNASAAGLWQFIPSTGQEYQLKQNRSYDGRRDIIESTCAAYDFLSTLHNRFGSWELALAAYNAGPSRIQRAIENNQARGLPTDFWSLNLPKETMNYVPRFLAVAQIVSDPQQYGVDLPKIANRQHFRSVPVNQGVTLYDVAGVAGIEYDELKKLNPGLKSDIIDAYTPNRVVVPERIADTASSRLRTLYANNNNGLPSTKDGLAGFVEDVNVPSGDFTASNNTSNINVRTNYTDGSYVSEPPISTEELSQFNGFQGNVDTLTNSSTRTQINPQSGVQSTTNYPVNTQAQAINDIPVSSEPPITQLEWEQISKLETQQSILAAEGKEKRISYDSSATATPNKVKPKGERSIYTVQKGDTLRNIAERAGVDWRDIVEWNQITRNPNTILVGTTLYLYDARKITPNKTPTTSSRAQPESYVVQRGDTLFGVANKFGLSLSELAGYNDISSSTKVRTGQRLWLVANKVKSTKAQERFKSYRVQRGDTLIGLSRLFNVPVDVISDLNDLDNSVLLIGQVLKLPTSANVSSNSSSTASISGNKGLSRYKVQSGDTLIGIAKDVGVSPSEIAAINPFESNARLQKGQTIKLPVSQKKVDVRLNQQPIKYKVKSGDTLIGLARKYRVAVTDLAAANNISTKYNVRIGQVLTIPVGGQSDTSSVSNTASISSSRSTSAQFKTQSYRVQSGDTLIGLANKYGVSTDELADANNISSKTRLRRGQIIKVPKQTTVYTVKSGDSLIALARRFGISTKELADMNNISSKTRLQRGQKLTVPNK